MHHEVRQQVTTLFPELLCDTEQAMLVPAQIIMYDEPTAGLDPVASTVIEDLIRQMSRGGMQSSSKQNGTGSDPKKKGMAAYIVVTHQHSTIRRAVDRIVFLHEGRVAWEGPVEEFDTTDEPIVRQFASGSLQGPITYL